MRPREERPRDAGERKGDDGSGHADGVGPDGNCADLVVIFVSGRAGGFARLSAEVVRAPGVREGIGRRKCPIIGVPRALSTGRQR